MIKHKKNYSLIFILIFVSLLISTLACGSTDEPELIATSSSAEVEGETTENSEAISENVVEETEPSEEEIEPTIEETEPIQTVYEIGDVINIGDKVIVVAGWEILEPNDFVEPDPGKVFVAVDLIIVNSGDAPINTSSILQVSLKDETSQKYNVDLMAQTLIKSGSIEGELYPGEKIRGTIGFQVSEEFQSLEFGFDAAVFGFGKVFVNLGSEPVVAQIPETLPGETEQNIFSIGDTIEINDMILTINEVSIPPSSGYFGPDEGYKFVVVDLTLKNNSSQSVNISSLLQMWVKDSESRQYSVDVFATEAGGGTLPDGEYAADETIRGQVGYQVPENETTLLFVFDAEFWGIGKVFVNIPLE